VVAVVSLEDDIVVVAAMVTVLMTTAAVVMGVNGAPVVVPVVTEDGEGCMIV